MRNGCARKEGNEPSALPREFFFFVVVVVLFLTLYWGKKEIMI